LLLLWVCWLFLFNYFWWLLFQIIIYRNISDRIPGMDEAADAGGAGGVGGVGAGDLYGELADNDRTNAIQHCLLTKIISPEKLLLECMEVHLMSVPQTDILTGDLSIDDVFALTSAGNHATIVCTCAGNVGSPEGRITAILEGEALPSGTGVTTRRYDQAVGVAQPLFNHSVDRLKELFVLGNHEIDISLLLGDWNRAWANFTDKIMEDLNVKGINAGREAFKDKLKVLFEKIRALKDDDPNIHELRRRYCIMAMDLLRNDLFRFFGPTIQKGVLATINIHNTSDDYLRHHGKPVIPGSAIEKAPYNLLILVNFVIGGHVYTIHIGIDREAVKDFLRRASLHEGKTGDDKYQSVSYWIGDVIKWIHDNKDKFFSIMRMVLDKSLPKVASVAPQIGIQHKQYLLDKMDEMLKRDQSSRPSLDHAVFVSGCKCFTLYHPELLFCNVDDYVDDSTVFRPSIIITTPNTDMTVGVYHGEHFVSVKPIIVKLPMHTELTITNIMFTLPNLPSPHGQLPLFHVPTYSENDELLNEVLKPSEGDSFGSFLSSHHPPSTDSLKLQALVAEDDVMEDEDDATEVVVKFETEKAPENADSASLLPSSAAEKAPAPPKAPAKKAKAKAKAPAPPKAPAPVVASLIEEIKGKITDPKTNPKELVERVVSMEEGRPGILKQALNAICGTFHYLLSPFTSLQRLGVTPHTILVDGNNLRDGTELLDPDTAMRISIVLMCALNYSENGKSIPNDQMELHAAERNFHAAEREFRAAKRKLRDAESLKPVKRMVTSAVTMDKLGRPFEVSPTEEEEDEEEEEEEVGIKSNPIIDAAILHMQNMQKKAQNMKSTMDAVGNDIEYLQSRIRESEDALSDNFQSVKNIIDLNHAEVEALRSYNPVYKEMILDRNSSRILVQVGGMMMRTLRRGVKKNTRRERRGSSIRSRCRSRRWQCRSSSGKLKKNTQRCRSRNSKTIRRRTTATRT
jgi:hypothetical protein